MYKCIIKNILIKITRYELEDFDITPKFTKKYEQNSISESFALFIITFIYSLGAFWLFSLIRDCVKTAIAMKTV